jgi:hypothetical protein
MFKPPRVRFNGITPSASVGVITLHMAHRQRLTRYGDFGSGLGDYASYPIVSGKNDTIFPADWAGPYLGDLLDAELHLIDTGISPWRIKVDEMIPPIRQRPRPQDARFLNR